MSKPTPRQTPSVEPDPSNIQKIPLSTDSLVRKLPLALKTGTILTIGLATALGVRCCLNSDNTSQSEIPEPTPVEGSQSTE